MPGTIFIEISMGIDDNLCLRVFSEYFIYPVYGFISRAKFQRKYQPFKTCYFINTTKIIYTTLGKGCHYIVVKLKCLNIKISVGHFSISDIRKYSRTTSHIVIT